LCHIKHTQAKKFLPFNRWIMLGHIIFIKTLSVYVPNILSFLLIFHELFSRNFRPQDSDRCSWHSKILFNSQKFLVKNDKNYFWGSFKNDVNQKMKIYGMSQSIQPSPQTSYANEPQLFSFPTQRLPKKFFISFHCHPSSLPLSLSLFLWAT